MRGSADPEGKTRWSKNNYHYTKVGGKWRFTHHLIAEERLGRPLADNERAVFKDKDRKNLSPDNIEVRTVGKGSTRRRMAAIEARILELQAQYRLLEEELETDTG